MIPQCRRKNQTNTYFCETVIIFMENELLVAICSHHCYSANSSLLSNRAENRDVFLLTFNPCFKTHMHKMLHLQLSLQFINVYSLKQVRYSAIRQKILQLQSMPSFPKKPLLLSQGTSLQCCLFVCFFKIYKVISCFPISSKIFQDLPNIFTLKGRQVLILTHFSHTLQLLSRILFILLQNLAYCSHIFHLLFPTSSVQEKKKK